MGFVLPRFYPILDLASLERRSLPLLSTAATVLEGGAAILQIRAKGHFSRELFADAERIGALCREVGATLIINDRADIARLIEGAGCHVGQDDLSPSAARQVLGDGRALGFSTHNEAQLRAGDAEPAVDYLALGPIFGTASKERPDPTVGVEELRRLSAATRRPLVAIGGITRATSAQVLAAGADSIAVIGDLFGRGGEDLRAAVEEWVALTGGGPRTESRPGS
jgi:thiamine-phosphate pyrophosphorylase